jgi:hypothetical protein
MCYRSYLYNQTIVSSSSIHASTETLTPLIIVLNYFLVTLLVVLITKSILLNRTLKGLQKFMIFRLESDSDA